MTSSGQTETAARDVGAFVLVVGPSGAGKDSVIDVARRELVAEPRIVFTRRIVTRAAVAEDHDTLSPAEFAAARQAGAFALSWSSHGLWYAIPAEAISRAMAGSIVVINASRGVIADAVRVAPRVVVALVTAPPAILAARLAARGRETAADIEKRLTRDVSVDDSLAQVVRIENSASIEQAGAAFVALLRRIAGSSQA